jgi:hypothetical protein
MATHDERAFLEATAQAALATRRGVRITRP